MYIPELSFQLDINHKGNLSDLLGWFHEEWKCLNIDWYASRTSGETEANRIQIGKNPYFDPQKFGAEDGWFYFPYLLVISTRRNPEPTQEDFDHQKEFARQVVELLRGKGCIVEIHAEFDLDE